MNIRSAIALAFAITISLAGCKGKEASPASGESSGSTRSIETPSPSASSGTSTATPGNAMTSTGTSTDLATAAQGNNRFALDLYARLRKQSGNLFVSPYSISSAFGMVVAGAAGQTRDEMVKVFHFTLPPDRLHPALGDLKKSLDRGAGSGDYELAIANRMWGQKGFPFLSEFREVTHAQYGAELEEADFQTDPDAARTHINAWIAGQTKDRIRDLFPPGSLGRASRLVLANAIYFKGQWALQFKKAATVDRTFHLSRADSVMVPTMSQEDTFGLVDDEDLQVLEMPYRGKNLAMLILLPRRRDGLVQLEANLSLERLESWRSGLTTRKVLVRLPRFTFSSKFTLPEMLAAMGMPSAFNAEHADFSGMDGKRDLFISSAIHQAFVEVNEEGTEAAAATGIGMVTTSMPVAPPVFIADHPFLIAIVDRATGSILFLGRVMDPRG